MRVRDADALVDELCRHYAMLPEVLRVELPLKQVWTIVYDDDLAGARSEVVEC